MNESQSAAPTREAHSFVPLDDDYWTDEVSIVTVPRYKTSELSGDEWRFSYQVEFRRKGIVWAQRRVGTMEYAVAMAAAAIHLTDFELREQGWNTIGDSLMLRRQNDGRCMNPGCAEPATVEYRLKKHYCRSGHESATFGDERRRFCAAHSRRGDCGLEDADRNYELIEGAR